MCIGLLTAALTEILQLSVDSFIDEDLSLAYRVEPLEEHIDILCDEMKLRHVERLQKGLCTLSYGFALNDLLTNLERVADHCSNIAVAIIELESDAYDPHQYLRRTRDHRSDAFDQYYEEYAQRFSV